MILLSEISVRDIRGASPKFDLKPLSPSAINRALERAHRYRMLNEPGAAESICLDILHIEPNSQQALVTIVLAMSDRFGKDYAIGDSLIYSFVARIKDEYARAYYTGIIYERRAKAALRSDGLNAYELFRQAMDWFEKAEELRRAGDDDPILRWNGCARIIIANKLQPRDSEDDFLE
jgi:hypothetical protein